MASGSGRVAVVVIGRNEGDRLIACLHSIEAETPVVYVDSNSVDNSVANAKRAGAMIEELDPTLPLTAARGRNAGWARVVRDVPQADYVQMVDGDCELDPQWLAVAAKALDADDGLAAVFGRRKEAFPEASIYNRQCDAEWNVQPGPALTCGDAMFRLSALEAAGGYDSELIAGEEPDLCLRLRAKGWRIKCLPAAMTTHDAAILRYGQWWRRTRRSGHAFAEHVWRNGNASIPSWRRQVVSIAVWALALPLIILIALGLGFLSGQRAWLLAAGIFASLYALQWARMTFRSTAEFSYSAKDAALNMIGKFAQLSGMLGFLSSKLASRRPLIIEYKSAPSRP